MLELLLYNYSIHPVFLVHCYNSLLQRPESKALDAIFPSDHFYIAVLFLYLAENTDIDFLYFIRVGKYQIQLHSVIQQLFIECYVKSY